MLTAVLLAAIGSADLWRSWARGRRAGSARYRLPGGFGLVVAIAVSWVVIVVLATTGLGVPLGMIALCLLAAGAWLWLTTSAEHETGRAGRSAVVGLIALVVLLFFFDRTGLQASGYLVDGHREAASTLLREAPLAAVVTVFGVVLFLCESANIVVRIALHIPKTASRPVDESSDDEMPVAETPADASAVDLTRVDLTRVDLKGGRLIGPLERLLIVALVLAGFPPIVAALVAAKGIVRFPEIADDVRNGDGLSGTKAEYFLVGSLVSWAVAGAAVTLIAISAHS